MAIVPLFKHRKQAVKLVGESGKTYVFRNGQYFSMLDADIAEMTKIAKSKLTGVYIDPDQPTIDTEAADPVSIMKKNLREQILMELAAEGKLAEASQSDQSPGLTKITSTADSTINGNSAAEEVAKQELINKATEQANKIVQTDSTLSALNKLKELGNSSQQTNQPPKV